MIKQTTLKCNNNVISYIIENEAVNQWKLDNPNWILISEENITYGYYTNKIYSKIEIKFGIYQIYTYHNMLNNLISISYYIFGINIYKKIIQK